MPAKAARRRLRTWPILPAPAPPSPPAPAAPPPPSCASRKSDASTPGMWARSSGSSSFRTTLRLYRGERFVASSSGSRPISRQYDSVSDASHLQQRSHERQVASFCGRYRPRRTRQHAGQARQTAAPQDVQEHRLHLVVRRVPDRDRPRPGLSRCPRQEAIAQLSRRLFDAQASFSRVRSDVAGAHRQRDAEVAGEPSDGLALLLRRLLPAQLVVEVGGVHDDAELAARGGSAAGAAPSSPRRRRRRRQRFRRPRAAAALRYNGKRASRCFGRSASSADIDVTLAYHKGQVNAWPPFIASGFRSTARTATPTRRRPPASALRPVHPRPLPARRR